MNQFSMNKRIIALAVLSIATLTACFKNDASLSTPRAGIMVNLLSPNATGTNIILAGTTIGSNVSYGIVPQFYNQVTAGTNSLVITNATNTLLSTTITPAAGKFYSVFLVDSLSRMQAITVVDSVNYPSTADTVKVRFYNFAPNSPGINVNIKDSATLWNSRSFETPATASVNNVFRSLKAGAYNLRVAQPGAGTAVVDTTITFEGGRIYTLYLKGFFNDSTGSSALSLGKVRHG